MLLGIYGASGCGRGVMPIGRAQFSDPEDVCVFIDDAPPDDRVNGHKVMTWEAFRSDPTSDKRVSLAIANSRIREKLADRCRQADIGLQEVRAATVVEMDDVMIGEGAILCDYVTMTSNIRIGSGFHANLYSYVEHDCVIGDFVTFAPRVMCNGNVHIRDHAYLGAGAIIRQGTPDRPMVIGKGAVVGMGAVVTKSVADGEVVLGNPARPIEA